MNNEYDMNVPAPAQSRIGGKSRVRIIVEGCPVNGSKFLDDVDGRLLWSTVKNIQSATGRKYATRRVTENGVEGYRFWRIS